MDSEPTNFMTVAEHQKILQQNPEARKFYYEMIGKKPSMTIHKKDGTIKEIFDDTPIAEKR